MNSTSIRLERNWSSGLRISPVLEDLTVVLNEWLTLFARANEAFPQTKSLWYIENTLTALLCAGAWRLGLPSITEVGTNRTYRDRIGKGHVDLAIDAGGAKSTIEAKICWFDDIGAFESVLNKLAEARSNANTLPGSVRRIALCFAVLKTGGTPLDTLLAEAIDRAQAENPDLLAWTLMQSASTDVHYPGCVMIGSVVTE